MGKGFCAGACAAYGGSTKFLQSLITFCWFVWPREAAQIGAEAAFWLGLACVSVGSKLGTSRLVAQPHKVLHRPHNWPHKAPIPADIAEDIILG